MSKELINNINTFRKNIRLATKAAQDSFEKMSPTLRAISIAFEEARKQYVPIIMAFDFKYSPPFLKRGQGVPEVNNFRRLTPPAERRLPQEAGN